MLLHTIITMETHWRNTSFDAPCDSDHLVGGNKVFYNTTNQGVRTRMHDWSHY